jgi:choline dehydrogenase-like flavoprotein
MIRRAADYSDREVVHCEVVVVGTGAGGAAAGATLAEAGVDVVLVEEGSWHGTAAMNPYLRESLPRLYREAGTTMIYGRSTFLYAEGRCVGGSTVINGGMTYRPPESVLADWERRVDPSLGEASLRPYFEQVERDIHVGPQAAHSVGGDNRLMAAGAARLGWQHVKNDRNQHHCVGANNCILGCPTGAKQSTLVSYMPRAMRAGARALTELRAVRLRIEGGRCVGVVCRAVDPRTMRPGKRVEIVASHTIIAGGAVQTPVLLAQHRVGRSSGQLGRNFVTHPNAKLVAVYPQRVSAWRGVSQWGQVREFHDDGIIFAENMGPPGVLAAAIDAHGDRAFDAMRRYDQMVLTGVLVEDSSAGRVLRGPFGVAVPTYSIKPLDFARFLRGLRALARLHFEMGAEHVYVPLSGLHRLDSADEIAKIDDTRLRIPDIELFTPHLMGTARMGAAADRDVVDLSGELFDLPGCSVADASLFPGPIGVNPQVTIMALALRVGERVASKVRRGRRDRASTTRPAAVGARAAGAS